MATKKNILDTHNIVTPSELYSILSMQLDRIIECPSDIDIMAPLLIHGSPGCGKSSIVRQICADRNIEFIDTRLAQIEPADIRGLPVPNREKHIMEWYVNGTWPRDPNGKGIIFLDEITSCDRSIQCAAYELVLDRRLGNLYKVPPGYLIVAAGNNTTDRAVAVTMSSALANRFMHVELKEDVESWWKWAYSSNIHPAVVGFIKFKPHMLFCMDEGQNLERGWPTPRSWERVSQLCHMYKDNSDELLRKLVYGTVGNGAGVEFMEFYRINAEFANILDIMTDPNSKIIIPKQADRKHALVSGMVYLLWRGKDEKDEKARLNGFYRICCELESDFASMALLAAIQSKDKAEVKSRAGKLLIHPMFKKWKELHGNALTQNLDLTKIFK
jgi:hypothetical protein